MNLAYSRVVYARITILYFVTSIALYRRKLCILNVWNVPMKSRSKAEV